MKKEGHPQLSGDIFSGTDGREQIADSDVETTAQKIAYGYQPLDVYPLLLICAQVF